jgi:hypothetical protein
MVVVERQMLDLKFELARFLKNVGGFFFPLSSSLSLFDL